MFLHDLKLKKVSIVSSDTATVTYSFLNMNSNVWPWSDSYTRLPVKISNPLFQAFGRPPRRHAPAPSLSWWTPKAGTTRGSSSSASSSSSSTQLKSLTWWTEDQSSGTCFLECGWSYKQFSVLTCWEISEIITRLIVNKLKWYNFPSSLSLSLSASAFSRSLRRFVSWCAEEMAAWAGCSRSWINSTSINRWERRGGRGGGGGGGWGDDDITLMCKVAAEKADGQEKAASYC